MKCFEFSKIYAQFPTQAFRVVSFRLYSSEFGYVQMAEESEIYVHVKCEM